MADKKVAPQEAEGEGDPSAPDGATSGEYVRQTRDLGEPYHTESTTRRALPKSGARTEHQNGAPRARALPGTAKAEEDTLPSARAPQRVRVSLRMRRAVAGPTQGRAGAPGPGDPVALRLAGQLFELLLGAVATAGRSPECELVLGDRLCSRRHAELSRADNGAVTVRDLQSTNGTYVNGIRIAAPCRLALGDWITIGNETFELCISTNEQRPATPTIPVGPNRNLGIRSDAVSKSKAKTDPGGPLLALASFAAMAASHTPTSIEPDLVKGPLEVLLQQVEEGRVLDRAAPSMAAIVSLRMARNTRDAYWVGYCFRLYAALRLPFSSEVLERLRETLSFVPHAELAPFDAYLEVLAEPRASGADAARQRLIEQLGELRAFFE